jgi:hypothetical protein
MKNAVTTENRHCEKIKNVIALLSGSPIAS